MNAVVKNISLKDFNFSAGIPLAEIHKEKWIKFIDTTCIALEVDDCEMIESAFEEVFNKHLDKFKIIHPMAMNDVDGVTEEDAADVNTSVAAPLDLQQSVDMEARGWGVIWQEGVSGQVQ